MVAILFSVMHEAPVVIPRESRIPARHSASGGPWPEWRIEEQPT